MAEVRSATTREVNHWHPFLAKIHPKIVSTRQLEIVALQLRHSSCTQRCQRCQRAYADGLTISGDVQPALGKGADGKRPNAKARL